METLKWKKNLKSVDNVEIQTKPLVFKGISVDKSVDIVDRTYVFKINNKHIHSEYSKESENLC